MSKRNKISFNTKSKKSKKGNNEIIESDSDLDEDISRNIHSSDEDSEKDYETPHEKKVRLTKLLLDKSKKEAEENDDLGALENQLKEDALEQIGKASKEVAKEFGPPNEQDDEIVTLRGHKKAVTCVVVSYDCKYIYSASKDGTIIHWNAKDGSRVKIVPGGNKKGKHPFHTAHILCMAISTDSKFLVTGDADNKIFVWDPASMQKLKILQRHRKPVTSLCFRVKSHQLFSGCADGNIYVWNLDIMQLIEDLVGHKSGVTSVDSFTRDRCISCSGGLDVSVHIWKIPEQSNLEFRVKSPTEQSLDCISMVNEEKFVTGSSTNQLYLWSITKASPAHVVHNAHCSTAEYCGRVSNGINYEMWINSVACLRCTDLVATGASDGYVRMWRIAGLSTNKPTLQPLFSIPLVGFVNDLSFSNDGTFLAVAVGQEHKKGRWLPSIKEAKNCVKIIRFKRKS